MFRTRWAAVLPLAAAGIVLLIAPAAEAQYHGRAFGYHPSGYYAGYPTYYYPGSYAGYYHPYTFSYGSSYYPSWDSYSYFPSGYGLTANSYQSFYAPSTSAALPTQRPAWITVRVPANAEVWFDGNQTNSNGAVRQYESPPLEPGTNYAYDIRARWTENGQTRDETRHVRVRGGDVRLVDFNTAAPAERSSAVSATATQSRGTATQNAPATPGTPIRTPGTQPQATPGVITPAGTQPPITPGVAQPGRPGTQPPITPGIVTPGGTQSTLPPGTQPRIPGTVPPGGIQPPTTPVTPPQTPQPGQPTTQPQSPPAGQPGVPPQTPQPGQPATGTRPPS